MTPEQIAKLRSELDVVQNNAQVFGEMLVTLQPGEEHPQDLDLLLVEYFAFSLQGNERQRASLHVLPREECRVT